MLEAIEVFTPKRGRDPRLERLRFHRRDRSRMCSCDLCRYWKRYVISQRTKRRNPNKGSRDYYLVYEDLGIHRRLGLDAA